MRRPASAVSSAATHSASNCAPAWHLSSAIASGCERATRYGRSLVMASNASGHQDDPRLKRYLRLLEAVGVAPPVESLVVVKDPIGVLTQAQGIDDPVTKCRVGLHHLELLDLRAMVNVSSTGADRGLEVGDLPSTGTRGCPRGGSASPTGRFSEHPLPAIRAVMNSTLTLLSVSLTRAWELCRRLTAAGAIGVRDTRRAASCRAIQRVLSPRFAAPAATS
jgi:hypothetical protein